MSELSELLPFLSVRERAEIDSLLQEAAAERARQNLEAFTQWTFPAFTVNWHHHNLCLRLDEFVAGQIKRLMVFMPPRHGKSELVSRRLPAYILGVTPDAHIIATSYGQALAARNNRDVQRIIDSPRYQELFPETRLYGGTGPSSAQGSYLRNSDMFEVVGHEGSYISAGVGGAITGMGGDYLLIDDPIKNREEADSLTYRNGLWEWYVSTLYTRAEKDAGILLTVTRWHEDDLAGRLLKQAKDDPATDQWVQVKYPALCEAESAAPDDPRADGEALWPAKYNVRVLNKIKAVLGPFQFTSIYQQSPRAREGNMFQIEKIKILDAAPAPSEILSVVRRWDFAATESTLADWTVGLKLARLLNGIYLVMDVRRGRWEPGRVELVIRQQTQLDGIGVIQLVEQEPGASGKTMVAHYITLLAGYPVEADLLRGDKVFRAGPVASQVDAGNVYMLRADWNDEFISELASFPAGAHDDQVDGLSGAFNRLALVGGVPAQEWIDTLKREEEKTASGLQRILSAPGTPGTGGPMGGLRHPMSTGWEKPVKLG